MADLKDLVEKRSPDSEAGVQKRMLLRTLREGQQAMRDKGSVYLPEEKNESNDDYTYRKDNNTSLYFGTEKSIEDINARIFSTEIKFNCEDEEFREMVLNNFSGSGDSLNSYAKSFNLNSIWNGGYFTLINFDTGIAFETDPYAVQIDIDNVLDMDLDDKGKITLFKYMVKTNERLNLFETQVVKYVYLYYIEEESETVSMQEYRYAEDEDEDYELIQDINLPSQFKDIPVVGLFPATRKKDLAPDRPYQNMADKNLSHWVFTSIRNFLVNVASRPFLFGSGFKQNTDPIKFGVKTVWQTSAPNADMKWVQADAKSADMIKDLLDEYKDEMKMLGSAFLETKQVMTASQAVINTIDTSSKASGYAQSLEDSLEKIVKFMALWKNKEIEFSIMANKNVGITKDKETLDTVSELNDKNVVSDKDLRATAISLGYLAHDQTEEEYLENLEAEGKVFNADANVSIVEETGEEILLEDEE
jgi:hypothetical protein